MFIRRFIERLATLDEVAQWICIATEMLADTTA
jgi:hypothetical protein